MELDLKVEDILEKLVILFESFQRMVFVAHKAELAQVRLLSVPPQLNTMCSILLGAPQIKEWRYSSCRY